MPPTTLEAKRIEGSGAWARLIRALQVKGPVKGHVDGLATHQIVAEDIVIEMSWSYTWPQSE